jgi:hypothetical protein
MMMIKIATNPKKKTPRSPWEAKWMQRRLWSRTHPAANQAARNLGSRTPRAASETVETLIISSLEKKIQRMKTRRTRNIVAAVADMVPASANAVLLSLYQMLPAQAVAAHLCSEDVWALLDVQQSTNSHAIGCEHRAQAAARG